MVAVGAFGAGRSQGQSDRYQREDQRTHIGEVVAGVGDQTGGMRDQGEPDLGDHQDGGEGKADGESVGSVHRNSWFQATNRADQPGAEPGGGFGGR